MLQCRAPQKTADKQPDPGGHLKVLGELLGDETLSLSSLLFPLQWRVDWDSFVDEEPVGGVTASAEMLRQYQQDRVQGAGRGGKRIGANNRDDFGRAWDNAGNCALHILRGDSARG